MKTKILYSTASALLLAITAHAQTTVFDTTTGASYTGSITDYGLAQSFDPSASGTLTSLNFTVTSNPANAGNISSVYLALVSGGLPDDSTHTLLGTLTAPTTGGNQTLSLDASAAAISLTAGTTYYIEIISDTVGTTALNWSQSQTFGGIAHTDESSAGAWRATSGVSPSSAFGLQVIEATPTPEPGTLALGGLGALGLFCFRRWSLQSAKK